MSIKYIGSPNSLFFWATFIQQKSNWDACETNFAGIADEMRENIIKNLMKKVIITNKKEC